MGRSQWRGEKFKDQSEVRGRKSETSRQSDEKARFSADEGAIERRQNEPRVLASVPMQREVKVQRFAEEGIVQMLELGMEVEEVERFW